MEPGRLIDVVRQFRDLAGGEISHVGIGYDAGVLPGGEDALDVVAIDGIDGLVHVPLTFKDARLLAGLDLDGVDVGLAEVAIPAASAIRARKVDFALAGNPNDIYSADRTRHEAERREGRAAGAEPAGWLFIVENVVVTVLPASSAFPLGKCSAGALRDQVGLLRIVQIDAGDLPLVVDGLRDEDPPAVLRVLHAGNSRWGLVHDLHIILTERWEPLHHAVLADDLRVILLLDFLFLLSGWFELQEGHAVPIRPPGEFAPCRPDRRGRRDIGIIRLWRGSVLGG